MTAQKLYSILKLTETLDSKLSLQTTLEAIKDALDNLVSSPAQPTYQASLATSLAKLSESAAKLRDSITPAQALAIKEMGGAEFFDPSIADKVTSEDCRLDAGNRFAFLGRDGHSEIGSKTFVGDMH